MPEIIPRPVEGGGIGGTTGTTDNAPLVADGTGGSKLKPADTTVAFPAAVSAATVSTGALGSPGAQFGINASGLLLANFGGISWSSDTTYYGTPDVILVRDAANTLALRNGPNAQTLNVYNTFTDAGDYARLAVTTVGTTADIYVQEAGTGVGVITAIRFNKKLNLTNVPTSSSGLSSGDVWSNLGILTIVA